MSTNAICNRAEQAGWQEVDCATWSGLQLTKRVDAVVCEEPMEIRVIGISLAVLMRTPGHDEDLVMGFLHSEGIVSQPQQVGAIHPCSEGGQNDNLWVVTPNANNPFDLAALQAARRNFYSTSSCGICGKSSIAAVMERSLGRCSPLSLTFAQLASMARTLSAGQPLFQRTGGVHAAALFSSDGALLWVREDVGRHNAVDKVLGAQLRSGGVCKGMVLMVSGRISFEIVQKAASAGVAAVAGVSAPSSLAIELAKSCGMTLAGFVRGERCVVYAGDVEGSP